MIEVTLERLTKPPRNVLLGKMSWPEVVQPVVSMPGVFPGGTCSTLEDALVYVPGLHVQGSDVVAGKEVAWTKSSHPTRIDECIAAGITSIKVPGWTAIPEGRYRMRFTWSNRFKRWLPELFDVRWFTAIRLHPGNSIHDTAGCILLGETTGLGFALVNSRETTDEFCRWLGVAEQLDEVWLEVKNPTT